MRRSIELDPLQLRLLGEVHWPHADKCSDFTAGWARGNRARPREPSASGFGIQRYGGLENRRYVRGRRAFRRHGDADRVGPPGKPRLRQTVADAKWRAACPPRTRTAQQSGAVIRKWAWSVVARLPSHISTHLRRGWHSHRLGQRRLAVSRHSQHRVAQLVVELLRQLTQNFLRLAKLCSAAVKGIEACPVEVEVNAGCSTTIIVIACLQGLRRACAIARLLVSWAAM